MPHTQTFDRVLAWINAAYPDGVPAADYAALLTVVRRHVSAEDVVSGADDLASIVVGELTPAHMTAMAAGVSGDEMARVAGRLVAAGWPLATFGDQVEPEQGPLQRALGGVVGWLKAGYPEGVPDGDFIPLVAILERRLTKPEMKRVRAELKAGGVIRPDQADIGEAIETVTHEQATPAEIDRVTAHLRKKGWPLELGD